MQNDNVIPPMQTGIRAQESERLIEEIQRTGVVESQDAAQAMPTRDEDVTGGTQPPSAATPLLRRG